LIFSFFFNAILAGEGDTKTGAMINIIGFAVNALMDPIFIYGFNWGVSGAAYATLFSYFISFVMYCNFLFIRKKSYLSFDLRNFRPSLAIINKIIAVGIPNALAHLVFSLNGLGYNKLTSFFGYRAIAGLGVGLKFDMLYFMPILGLTIGLVTLTGMFIGAKKYQLAKEAFFYTLKISLYYTCFISLLLYLFIPQLSLIFTRDQLVIDYAVDYIRIGIISYFFVPFGFAVGRFLQGMGNGLPVLIISSLRVLIINMPLAYYWTRVLNYQITYLWWSQVVSSIASVFLAFGFLAWGLKKLKTLELKNNQEELTKIEVEKTIFRR
jgi:putative MATE family efflux protein